MTTSFDTITLGITGDEVPLGTHLLYPWRTDQEFECGVRFLELGFASESEYCVLFGHDEANQRVLETLERKGHNPDRLRRDGRLAILRRDAPASTTLANIEAAFSTAVRNGAKAIRYLGNLGTGQAPLPGRGADEVVELETGATGLALRYPCVMVCMYDVNTVSGRLLLNAGFATHPLTVWQDALRQNPYYSSEEAPAHSHGTVA
ncbi:MAG TPA: MEDS domain-containing protein [Terriglobia bacterium]|nr:MEDS domain-containing protein [Terriglobia bacterium]